MNLRFGASLIACVVGGAVGKSDAGFVNLISIDYHLMREDHKKSIAAVNAIDKLVGGDPLLDQYRGNISFIAKNYDDCEKFAARLQKNFPQKSEGQLLLIQCAAAQKQFEKTVKLLEQLEEIGYELNELEGDPQYAEFIKSNAYKKWKATK